MRVKTFEATSMQEALSIVKREMGEEAFILSTRPRQRKTAMGLTSEPVIEVTAAVDEPGQSGAGVAETGVYGLRPPLANRAPAGAKMSLPWNVAETTGENQLASVSSTVRTMPPMACAAGQSTPLSGPTRIPLTASMAMARRDVPTPGSTTAM